MRVDLSADEILLLYHKVREERSKYSTIKNQFCADHKYRIRMLNQLIKKLNKE